MFGEELTLSPGEAWDILRKARRANELGAPVEWLDFGADLPPDVYRLVEENALRLHTFLLPLAGPPTLAQVRAQLYVTLAASVLDEDEGLPSFV